MFKKILITNRGMWRWVLRACKKMNISSVVAHSIADVTRYPYGLLMNQFVSARQAVRILV